MKVFCYFNLHKKTFSIKALEGANKGKVVMHSDFVRLKDCAFKVSEAGRQRVIREKRKNVHAGVVGELVSTDRGFIVGEFVTYNPYKYDCFVKKHNEEPIRKSKEVALVVDKSGGIKKASILAV